MDGAEHGWDDLLPCHAVEQPRRHHEVDQGSVGDREQRDRREEPQRDRRPGLDDLEQRRVGAGELVRVDDGRRRERDEEVDSAGREDAGEQRGRVVPGRILRLLGDVRGVLEADQRVERERRAVEDREQRRLALLEVEVARDVRVAATDRPSPIRITSTIPLTSTNVSAMFTRTDSEMPRKLISATTAMKASET